MHEVGKLKDGSYICQLTADEMKRVDGRSCCRILKDVVVLGVKVFGWSTKICAAKNWAL